MPATDNRHLAAAERRVRSAQPWIITFRVLHHLGVSGMSGSNAPSRTKANAKQAISPLIYSWSGQNTAGDTKRKVTTGMLFVGASAGNIIGPNLYKPSEAPHYTRGLRSNLALFVVIIVLVGLGVAWIRILNRRHSAERVRMGKAANVVDLSMENAKALGKHEEAVNDGETAGGVGDKAFDDVTDLRNEDFIYVY